MKVIFIKDLKGKGKINDIKEVSDGYAMNFLIKNGYAVAYTKTSVDKLNQQIANNNEKERIAIENSNKIKQKLEKEKLVFPVKTGVNQKVFGTISSKQIIESLNSLGYKLDKKMIEIDNNISSLGTHVVKVNLHKKVEAKLTINLVEKNKR